MIGLRGVAGPQLSRRGNVGHPIAKLERGVKERRQEVEPVRQRRKKVELHVQASRGLKESGLILWGGKTNLDFLEGRDGGARNRGAGGEYPSVARASGGKRENLVE